MLVAKEIKKLTTSAAVLEHAAQQALEEGHAVEYRFDLLEELKMQLPDLEERIEDAAKSGIRYISPVGEYTSRFKIDFTSILREYFSAMGFTCHETMRKKSVYGEEKEKEYFETFICW